MVSGGLVTSGCLTWPCLAVIVCVTGTAVAIDDPKYVILLIAHLPIASAEWAAMLFATEIQAQHKVGELQSWLASNDETEYIERSFCEFEVDANAISLLEQGFAVRRGVQGRTRIRLFQVVGRRCMGGAKSFPMGYTTYIFLPDKPVALSSYRKFLLYHELGHAYPLTQAYETIKYSTAWSLSMLAFLIFSLQTNASLAVVSFSIIAVVRLCFFHGSRTKQMGELTADQFAMYFLKQDLSMCEIADRLEKYHRQDEYLAQRVQLMRQVCEGKKTVSRPGVPLIPYGYALLAYSAIMIMSVSYDTVLLGQIGFFFTGMTITLLWLWQKNASRSVQMRNQIDLIINRANAIVGIQRLNESQAGASNKPMC